MSVTPSDVLFAWDAAHGIVPTVGGQPSFSRGGDKWVRTRARGGGPLYQKVVGDQLGFSWVEKGGVLLPRRALDVEGEAITPQNDDSADLDPASTTWSTFNSPTVTTGHVSAFGPDWSAIKVVEASGQGTSQQWIQDIGTFSGNSETWSMVVERVPGTQESDVWIFDSTAPGFVVRARIDWATGTASIVEGSGSVAILDEARPGPNRGPHLMRVAVTADSTTAGNNRRVGSHPGGRGSNRPGEGLYIHHAQHEEQAYAGSPILYAGSPATRPAESASFNEVPSFEQSVVTYAKFVHGGVQSTFAEYCRFNGASSHVRFEVTPGGSLYVVYDNGSAQNGKSINVGADVGDVVEHGGVVKTDSSVRSFARVDGGAASGSPFSGTISWVEPTEGSVQLLPFDNSRHQLLRLLAVKRSAVDADTGGADDAGALDELADVPVGPNRAGVAT